MSDQPTAGGARLDPELGIVWPVTIQMAGLAPHEIGVIPGGHGPDRALDELALLFHEWADFIAENKAEMIGLGLALQTGGVDL